MTFQISNLVCQIFCASKAQILMTNDFELVSFKLESKTFKTESDSAAFGGSVRLRKCLISDLWFCVINCIGKGTLLFSWENNNNA